MELQPTSIYGEIQGKSTAEILIEIDLSGKKQSLLELIQYVRSQTEQTSDDATIIIYLVCGKQVTDNDWIELFDYIWSIPNSKLLVYRGYIHPETIKSLLIVNNLTLDKDVKLMYYADKLNLMLKNLFHNPDIFRRFLERWIEKYNETLSAEYGVDELKQLGFEFKLLGQ